MKIKTFLPVFPGFYSTIFEPDEDPELSYINSERTSKGLDAIDFDEVTFDYSDYHQQVAEQAAEFIESKMSDFISGIEDISVHSPKEYNFVNDSIHCTIDINTRKIREYLMECKEEFSGYLHRHYTTRSGFISSYSNEFMDWIDDIEHEHKAGAALNFIAEMEDIDQHDMYDNISAHLSASNYEEVITWVRCPECNKLDNEDAVANDYNRIKEKQVALYKELMGKEPVTISLSQYREVNKNRCWYCGCEF